MVACCTEMPAFFSAQIETFLAINTACFLAVNSPVFPSQLHVDLWLAITDTQGGSSIVEPTLPVVDDSALHQQPAYQTGADIICLQQEMQRFTLLGRPTSCSIPLSSSGHRPASSTAGFRLPTVGDVSVLPPVRRIPFPVIKSGFRNAQLFCRLSRLRCWFQRKRNLFFGITDLFSWRICLSVE